jgi:hypothetical protein
MEDAIVEPAAADPARTKKSCAHRVDCGHAIAITLDAGYIRSNDRSEKGSRWFSATVARLVGTEGAGVCHGYARKEIGFPSGRLDRFLANEGIGEAAALAVISDGGEDVLGAGNFHFRASQQLLDWVHIAMRFQHLWQELGSIEQAPSNGYFSFRELLESAKWRLWHHKPVYCFSELRYLFDQLESLPQTDVKAKAKKLLQELTHYLYRNEHHLGDYANRYRAGLPVSSATAESAVNCIISKRFAKKQQVRWSSTGANALLQIRCAVLNGRYERHFQLRAQARQAANDSTALLAA